MIITGETYIGDVYRHPKLAPVKPYAIYKYWDDELIFDHPLNYTGEKCRWFLPDVIKGLQRLVDVADSEQEVAYFLYSPEEIQDDPQKKDVCVVHFPAEGNAPFAIVCAGGSYTQVYSLTEAFSVAARLNELGYHAFVLNYRVGGEGLFPKPIDDLAKAVRFVLDNAGKLNVDPKDYLITGYSAGGNLVNNFCSDNHGYSAYGLPAPRACFPVYSVATFANKPDEYYRRRLGEGYTEETIKSYTVLEHMNGYPPAYIVACKDDDLVPYVHSELIAQKLEEKNIPHILELGDRGGHGFGLGSHTDVAGWLDRAVAFARSL